MTYAAKSMTGSPERGGGSLKSAAAASVDAAAPATPTTISVIATIPTAGPDTTAGITAISAECASGIFLFFDFVSHEGGLHLQHTRISALTAAAGAADDMILQLVNNSAS